MTSEIVAAPEQGSLRARLSLPTAAVAAVAAGYYLGALLGFQLRFPDSPHSILWPPNAILLAALILLPARLWPWCLAAVLPVHIAISLPAGVPWGAVLGFYFTNTAQAVLGAALYRQYVSRYGDRGAHAMTIAFIVSGVFLAPALLSFADVAIALWTGWSSNDYWQAWTLRFMSNAASAAIIVPPMLAAARAWRAWRKPAPRRLVEACLLALGVVALGSFAVLSGPSFNTRLPLLFCAYLPLMLWAAMRFGKGGASWVVLGLATATMGSIAQWPPGFAGQTEILMQQAIFLLVSIPVLYLGSLYGDLQQSMRRLNVAAARHDMATRAAAIGVWEWDPRTDALFIHPHLKRLIGYEDHEIPATVDGWGRHYHPDDLEKVVRPAHACARGESMGMEVEHRMIHRDGSVRWLMTRGAPVREADGSMRLVGTCVDVTDRKRIEEELRSLRLELAHVTRVGMLGELSGAIAHEINQPLAAILTNSQAAQRLLARAEPDVAEVQDALGDIADSAKRAGTVIHGLRDLLQKGEPAFRPLDINKVASEVLELLHSDLIAHQVSVARLFGTSLPSVSGDRIQLQQVFLNLIMNASEAMSGTAPGERVLTITTTALGGRSVEICVADTGKGIAPDMQEHLFEAFATTKKRGLGMGLSICRSIVSAHGGRQWAENRPEGGAAFYVSLPAHRP